MGYMDELNPPGYPQYKKHVTWTPEYEWKDRKILDTLPNGWTIEVVHDPDDLAADRSMGIGNCSYYGVWQPRYKHLTHVILSLRDKNGKPLANINCGNAEHIVELYAGQEYDRYGEPTFKAPNGEYREHMYYSYHVGEPFKRIPRGFFGRYWYPLEFLNAGGGDWGERNARRQERVNAVAAWWNKQPKPRWAVEIQGYGRIDEACKQMHAKMQEPFVVNRDRLGRFSKKGA